MKCNAKAGAPQEVMFSLPHSKKVGRGGVAPGLFFRLSATTLYRRFHRPIRSVQRGRGAARTALLDIDHHEQERGP